MLLLALDTATETGSLALVAADRVLMEYSLESPNAYLTCLMPGVAAILRKTGQGIADLGAVAVSTGPGNFTGLRIGLATAKTLAWSLKCPLVPVPTLEALAGRGHRLREVPSQGVVEAIRVHPREGLLEGGCDRRAPDGAAIGR